MVCLVKIEGHNVARTNNLLTLSMSIMNGEDAVELISKYQEDILNITPYDMIALEDMQLQNNVSVDLIKKYIDKLINVFYKGLSKYQWEKPHKETFLYLLMAENEELKQRLADIKQILLLKDMSNNRLQLLAKFKELSEIEKHYSKKENILFPYLENRLKHYRSLRVMWSLDDDTRKKLKQVIELLRTDNMIDADIKREIGVFFFLIYGLIKKEELVVFPIASEVIEDSEWEEMLVQSNDYGFSFIPKPNIPVLKSDINEVSTLTSSVLRTETGVLSVEQFLLVMNKLPLDITFVDENNKVRYFTKPDDRIFQRSPAIIGREVQNCHPPESVHIVNEIIDEFRKGSKDYAKFWLELQGRFIVIQYFALRDNEGLYKGVLEVSQDVTEIRSLTGQQRILDWKK